MQDLAAMIGARYIYDVVGINDAGRIAGTYLSPDTLVHAFLYTPGSGINDLGSLGGDQSRATGLNNNGQVVGTTSTAANEERSFLWSPTDGMEDVTAVTGFKRIRLLNDNLQTVVGSKGWWDIDEPSLPRLIQLSVTSNAAPVARFTWSCVQLTCTFDASSSTDDQGIVSYAWTWGKTPYNKGSGVNPTTSYPSAGPRTVTLTVTDANGLTGTVTKTIDVGTTAPPANTAPVASFTWSCPQLTCSFDASGSTDDKGIVSYTWTWGKTPYNNGSGITPWTSYPAPGR
jgi:probable HAF family extracellular repeat protein